MAVPLIKSDVGGVSTSTPFIISKVDEELGMVFGYANVSVAKGADGPFKDLQDDIIPVSELERAAYRFVLDFRKADQVHDETAVGELVESMVFTPDKLKALATDPRTGMVAEEALAVMKQCIPPRWWVGFKLVPSALAKVKSGDFSMFSIGGESDRDEVDGGGR